MRETKGAKRKTPANAFTALAHTQTHTLIRTRSLRGLLAITVISAASDRSGSCGGDGGGGGGGGGGGRLFNERMNWNRKKDQ